MASCRSSAWAFLRGEKKCIDYRSIERGLAVVFAFSFSDANGERGGGRERERERERGREEGEKKERVRTVLLVGLSRITSSANRLC